MKMVNNSKINTHFLGKITIIFFSFLVYCSIVNVSASEKTYLNEKLSCTATLDEEFDDIRIVKSMPILI